jgi:hypothetical protein
VAESRISNAIAAAATTSTVYWQCDTTLSIMCMSLTFSYAPCVVKSNIWNRDANMTQYCGDNLHNFQTYVLSISDEAFLLLMLINYSATWMAEIEDEQRKVCCLIVLLC